MRCYNEKKDVCLVLNIIGNNDKKDIRYILISNKQRQTVHRTEVIDKSDKQKKH